jgi:uncharacterized membrane protein (UPF0127 family)
MIYVPQLTLHVDDVEAGGVIEGRGFLGRMHGLMGWTDLPDGVGLFFRRCSSVQTCFMRFPLGVAHFGDDGLVIKVASGQPWHVSGDPGATTVIELCGDIADDLAIVLGARVELSK